MAKTFLQINDATYEVEHDDTVCEMPNTYVLTETGGTLIDAFGKQLEDIGPLNAPVVTCAFCGAEAVRVKTKKGSRKQAQAAQAALLLNNARL